MGVTNIWNTGNHFTKFRIVWTCEIHKGDSPIKQAYHPQMGAASGEGFLSPCWRDLQDCGYNIHVRYYNNNYWGQNNAGSQTKRYHLIDKEIKTGDRLQFGKNHSRSDQWLGRHRKTLRMLHWLGGWNWSNHEIGTGLPAECKGVLTYGHCKKRLQMAMGGHQYSAEICNSVTVESAKRRTGQHTHKRDSLFLRHEVDHGLRCNSSGVGEVNEGEIA